MSIRTRAVAVGAATAVALAITAMPALAKTYTVTTPANNAFAFVGMPKTLKAGTYTFTYVNKSEIVHNLRVGTKATALFSKGSKTVTVTLKKGTVKYQCDPHSTMMKGTITVM